MNIKRLEINIDKYEMESSILLYRGHNITHCVTFLTVWQVLGVQSRMVSLVNKCNLQFHGHHSYFRKDFQMLLAVKIGHV